MEAVSKFFRCKAEPTTTTAAAMGETINAYPFLIVLSVYTLTHSVTLCALYSPPRLLHCLKQRRGISFDGKSYIGCLAVKLAGKEERWKWNADE